MVVGVGFVGFVIVLVLYRYVLYDLIVIVESDFRVMNYSVWRDYGYLIGLINVVVRK